MPEHLTYVSDHQPAASRWQQISRELWFTFVYTFDYIAGIFHNYRPYTQGERRSVVLVPGFLGRPLAMGRLRRHLIANGYNVYTVGLGLQMGSLEKKSRKLEDYLIKNDIKDCYMVAHSMGGLIALGMSYRGGDRIRKLITLGTPFGGTWVTWPLFFIPAARQMRPGSKIIASLRGKERLFHGFQAVFADTDQIIWPNRSCRLLQIDDVRLNEFGHFNLVMGPTGIDCITEILNQQENKDPKESKDSKSKSRKKSDLAGKKG